MSLAWLVGARIAVPQDATPVRSTIEPVRTDGPAEDMNAPGFNEVNVDSSGQLVGLSPRQESGDVHDSAQYVPWWVALASNDYEKVIDDQVSSSGTAAAREAGGVFGHGTFMYTESIEPAVRDGSFFGNDYFVTNPLGANELGGNYMQPTIQPADAMALAQAFATDNSRKAYQSTLYGQWFGS